MANLPTHATTTNADASGFKLFGQVIQPEAHRAASVSISISTGESTAPTPTPTPSPPPPPPPAPSTTQQATVGGGEPLPCPRCGSRETKFCYFNNYNVNQPRHFCRACHRYWTAGGAIRNVPVGSGRRKNRPVLHGASTVMSADNPLAGSASQGMVNGLGFHPDHGWSQVVPSPAYLGHGEMEQCWWLVHQYPAQGQVNGDVQLSPSSLRVNQYA